ncbi:unnamed protein product [Caenorhabditis brenneri]
MRSSAVNVLMIGLAMSDMTCCFIDAREQIYGFIPENLDVCNPPDSYSWKLFILATIILYEICRRLSPWIGVIMAFVRLLISSFPFNNTIGKMGEPPFAVCSLIISLLMSISIEADAIFLSKVVVMYEWIPKNKCGFPRNYSQPAYFPLYSTALDVNRDIVFGHLRRIFKFLPSMILPLLTFGLVMVLRKIRVSKQKIQKNSRDTTYQITRLVTIMTCCLVATELTTGLLYLFLIPSSSAA